MILKAPHGAGLGDLMELTPVFVYCLKLLLADIAYTVLQLAIIAVHGRTSELARAVGSDFKGKFSLVAYIVAMALTFVQPMISVGVTIIVALVWFIPDRRIEKAISG